MSRSRKGSFSRESETSNTAQPDWFIEYSENLKKLSVQPAHKDRALYDQINDILGTKSRYATVEEAVTDMHGRTGLATYLQMCESEKSEVLKTAFDKQNIEMNTNESDSDRTELENSIDPDSDQNHYPQLLKDHPEIESFINNFIKDRNGYIHVPAVVESIRIIFRNEDFSSDELEDKHLRKFINEAIIKEKSLHENDNSGTDIDLGKLDNTSDSSQSEENNDAFSILMPVKM